MVFRTFPAVFAPAMLGLLAAGCAAPGAYPSLLPRAAESQSLEEPAVATPAAPAADPALDARIKAALQSLDERVAAFDAAADTARRQVALAGRAPAGSTVWLDAQLALAELDTRRSATLELASPLDDLAGERALEVGDDYPPLTAAVEKVRAAGAAQAERIAELQKGLAPA